MWGQTGSWNVWTSRIQARRHAMILVTGAGGFSGSRVVARLVQEGEPVRAMVRNPAKQTKLPEKGVEIVESDTTKPDTLTAALRGVDTVIHTAFITADRKQGPGV